MADTIFDFGLTGGAMAKLRNRDGAQDKEINLNNSGDLTIGGVVKGNGNLELLLSQEAAGSSSLDFSSTYVTGAYDVYLLVGEGIVVATDRADLHLLVSNDGGSTWEADASEYKYAGFSPRSSSASLTTNSSGATFFRLNPMDLSNVVADGWGFNIYIKGAARAGAKTVFEGTTGGWDYQNLMNCGSMGAIHDTAEVVNGLRIIPDIGNITRGRVTLYGLRHA